MATMASADRAHWERSLGKNLMLLGTLVATVTFAAGFNPPGGVWQDTDGSAGRIAGEPIIRDTSYRRYLAFFYSNTTAFACSLVTILLLLILPVVDRWEKISKAALYTLRFVMVVDLLSLVGAYTAGTSQDKLTTIFSSVFGICAVVYVSVLTVQDIVDDVQDGMLLQKRSREVLMLLAMFAVSVTYLAGLNTPGGFWDHEEGGRLPGETVLKGRHDGRLNVFFIFNTAAFYASLLILVQLLDKADPSRLRVLYFFVVSALFGLVGAYVAGSSRETSTTIYMIAVAAAVPACSLIQVVIHKYLYIGESVKIFLIRVRIARPDYGRDDLEQTRRILNSRTFIELLATLAATITYQAGLDPPGGVWQDDGDGHMAGDPILLSMSPRRYKMFFYCNSVAFVASLVAIIFLNKRVRLMKFRVLESAVILMLFGLIGAYTAGSCRDVSTSVYAMALAGAALSYVVIHVSFFALNHDISSMNKEEIFADIKRSEKKRQWLLLFAIMAATLTYQAGLTPPGSFWLQDDELGHKAGEPVLLYNYPRRYRTFFYCNTVTFMLSIALIILLINANLYRPAIRSNALSVCTVGAMFSIVGAYAAGSTQHLKTSFYIFALAAVVMSFTILLVVVILVIHIVNKKDKDDHAMVQETTEQEGDTATMQDLNNAEEAVREEVKPTTLEDINEMKLRANQKYLMALGILVAGVTYQAGLKPPGGMWQSDSIGHVAGNPIMNDTRRLRYLAFFYINSASFVASIAMIILLLLESLQRYEQWSLMAMNTTIAVDLLGLLIAYAVGSCRSWMISGSVFALVIAVFAYVAIHVTLSRFFTG